MVWCCPLPLQIDDPDLEHPIFQSHVVKDPPLCPEHITEMIVSSMEVYIPHFFSI
ncbi:hypothetical protein E2C01_069409 [Portunus trituberculatus]|uniref:Uncharacterized protein n=1 Tax=Portunus trituberculatus TaxID=210409 RepID=A0A5B7HZA5_PORTR|nr:hypothetical protein [Portunus trituberculatus]